MTAAELAVELLLGQLPWLPARCRHRVAVSALPQRCRHEDQRFLQLGGPWLWTRCLWLCPAPPLRGWQLHLLWPASYFLLPTCYLLLLTSYLLLPTFYFLERGVGYPPPADLR